MSGSFADLRARTLSAIAMVAVGGGAIWLGGYVFAALVAVLVGLMVHELGNMVAPARGRREQSASAILAALWLLVVTFVMPQSFILPALAVAAVLLALRAPAEWRGAAIAYLALILAAGFALIILRGGYGLAWVLWLVALVIGSDIAGYFAGRLIGGPKLWPRVSPKKTWSGTVAGWLLAVAIGAAFMGPLGAGAGLILASVLVAMAGQAGDIAESAIKRRAGVKDSSNLIPGHGGVLDRFDAMIAAAVMAGALLWLMPAIGGG